MGHFIKLNTLKLFLASYCISFHQYFTLTLYYYRGTDTTLEHKLICYHLLDIANVYKCYILYSNLKKYYKFETKHKENIISSPGCIYMKS